MGSVGQCAKARGGQAQAKPEEARKAAGAEERRGRGRAGRPSRGSQGRWETGGSQQQRDTVTFALKDKCFSMHETVFRRMCFQESINISGLGGRDRVAGGQEYGGLGYFLNFEPLKAPQSRSQSARFSAMRQQLHEDRAEKQGGGQVPREGMLSKSDRGAQAGR